MFKSISKEELQVPAEIQSLKKIRDFIARIGKKYRLSDKTVNAFKLACDEASTNVIRHAYRDGSGMITVRAIVRKQTVTVSLLDQGRFFDPKAVKDPDLKRYVAIGKKGGLGIMMIRKLVDDIDYRKTEEGNELRLTNKREVRERRFPVPTPAKSLRLKYYSYTAAIVSVTILVIFSHRFLTADERIIDDALNRMRSISAQLANNSLDDLLAESPQLSVKAKGFVEQNEGFVDFAIITDSNGKIQGSSDPSQFLPGFGNFSPPSATEIIDENTQIAEIPLKDGDNGTRSKEFFVVMHPVVPRGVIDNSPIGAAYMLVPPEPIYDEAKDARIQVVKVFFMVLLAANLGVGLLIMLVFIPLQKLSTWVKNIGEGDIKDQIEIDSSDEIGKIAQAFSDITDKFRETQKSLVDQERIQQEMHLAKEIQQTLLPAEFPRIEGYEIASHYESAKEVGGDYYDFVEIDRHRMGVVVADVSGKGVPGSLVMTMIRTALRTEAKGKGSAADVLARVNDFIMDDIRKGMFVTLFYIILDSRKRRITFASAGHNPIILYRNSTKKTYYLNPKGFPVGIALSERDLFKRSIEDDTIQLSKGDIILCHTDGITEAMNSRRELFGEERLLKVVRDYGHLRAKLFVERLTEEITSFTEGQIQNDDITFVVIKENMNADEAEFELAKRVHYEILNGHSMSEACQEIGIPASTFSHKYRADFEEMGVDRFKREYETTSVEAKHLGIEEQTKIYDIIRKHPEWGPKRLSEQLEKAEYGYSKISGRRIYDELVRKRLNTRQLREAYVARGENKTRMKPPGTPMLTLDGQIIMEELPASRLSAPIEPPVVSKPEDKPPKTKKPRKSTAKEKKKASAQSLTPLEEKEVSEYVLKDIVDLLDKNKGEAQSVDSVANSAEDQKESSERALDKELEAEEDHSGKETVEIDPRIKKLLGDLEVQEPAENEAETEIDFSDLSAAEYTQELFDDRSNGDNELSTESDAIESSAESSSETHLSAEDVLNSLSVQIHDSTEEKENGPLVPEAGEEDFIELMSSEDDIGYSGEEASESDGDTGRDSGTPDDRSATVSQLEPGKDVEENDHQSTTVELGSPEQVLDHLSVAVEEDMDQSSNSFAETSEKKTDEILDLLSDEDEIDLEQELLSSDPSKEESSQHTQREKPRFEDKQQKMLVAGGHYYMQKKYEKAVSVFKRIVRKYPQNIEAFYNLGNSYFRLNEWEEARNAYEEACRLDPTFLDAIENLGVIHANQKNFKKAVDVWKRLLEYDPKRTDIKKKIEKALKLSKGI